MSVQNVLENVKGKYMTISDLQRIIQLRNIEKLQRETYSWCCADWGNAIASEVGEMCDKIKRLTDPSEKRITTKQDVLNEIADIIICCAMFSAVLDANLEEVIKHKFNITSERICSKYFM